MVYIVKFLLLFFGCLYLSGIACGVFNFDTSTCTSTTRRCHCGRSWQSCALNVRFRLLVKNEGPDRYFPSFYLLSWALGCIDFYMCLLEEDRYPASKPRAVVFLFHHSVFDHCYHDTSICTST